MKKTMAALVYEGPRQLILRQTPIPVPRPDEVLIRVVYSGICGSELSGYKGESSIRRPPLIMGHEFSGTIEHIGGAVSREDLAVGMPVTANPLLSCTRCRYCLSGRQHLCPDRQLLSASLPGSNAAFVAIRADAVSPVPPAVSLTTAALAEPTACAIHAAVLAAPEPDERGLVVGAGPIGLLVLQALMDRGLHQVFCIDLNQDRLAMAEKLGALPATFDALASDPVDFVVDAVGASATRQGSARAVKTGGRIVWIGLHEGDTTLPVNDFIRREISTFASYAYTPVDFHNAINALAENRILLDAEWTRSEPLKNGSACFDDLLGGSAISKIWLMPDEG